MTDPSIVGAIGGDGSDRLIGRYWRQQGGKDFGIMDRGGGQFRRNDLMRAGIHRQMKFTPGPPSLDPVLAPMPLARAVNLQAGGIHHKMTWWFTGTPSDLDGQGRRPAAERAVVWNGHVHAPNNVMIDRINPSMARHGR